MCAIWWGVSQAIWHRYCLNSLSATPSLSVLVYPSFAFVWPCCVQYVCCVAVQGVNGHSRKVTVWGRKDSIVYRHPPCSWRWTTMVSLISFWSCLSTYSVDIHSEVLYQIKYPTRNPHQNLHSLFCSPLIWEFSLGLICFYFTLTPQSNTFWNMHWIEPR